jgi:hypothetical protein
MVMVLFGVLLKFVQIIENAVEHFLSVAENLLQLLI